MILEKNDRALTRIGFLYSIYRIAISLILSFIVFSSEYVGKITPETVVLFSIILTYFITTNLQLFSFATIGRRRFQIMLFGLFDLIIFTLITWHIGRVETQIGLLFILTIFILSLTQKKQHSFLLTLFFILSMLLMPTYSVLFNNKQFISFNFLSSIILSSVYLIINLSTIFYSKKFNNLLNISEIKTKEVSKLRDLGNEIINGINVGYIVVNNNGFIELINKKADLIFKTEFQSKTLSDLHKTLSDLHKGCSDELKKMMVLFKDSGNFNIDIDNETYLVCFKPLINENLLLLTFENIKDINNRVQHLKLMELGQLSASVSHEIRNPLAIIGQANELIARNPDFSKYCNIISKQINRIDSIINSTLNMVKSDVFNPHMINLNDFMHGLINDSLPNLKDDVVISVDGYQIMFDENHLEQVFINLTLNAHRHGSLNGISSVLIKAHIINNSILAIDVIDKGLGVSSDKVQNLFQPFFTTSINGTGLGLYLSQSLCETNNSTISYIKSDLGTCFRVSIQAWDLIK